MRKAIVGGLVAAVLTSWLALGDGINVPFSMPATTCTNQFIRSIASATGVGTCNSVAIGSDVAGLGTGVATALGTNVGSAGAVVTNGGALGTPSSGTVTNLSGTASGLTAGAVSNLTISSATSVGRGQYQGTGTNDNATAGNIGQTLINSSAIGSISLTTGTAANLASQALTAGDWLVYCTGYFTYGTTTNYTNQIVSLSTTSATLDVTPGNFGQLPSPTASGAVPTASVNTSIAVGPVRISTAGTPTVYCVGFATFTVNTATAGALLTAVRIR